MISKLFKWAAAITCALPLVAGAETVGDWFFGGVEGSQVAVTNATWETSGVDVSSALEVDNDKIVVDNDGTDTLDLVPTVDAPDTNVLTRVIINSTFPPNEYAELDPVVDAKTALTLAINAGDTNYYAYTGSEWIPLSGATLPASDEEIVTAIVELNAYESSVKARFKIGDDWLINANDNDNQWIALSTTQANVTKVSFAGSCLLESVETKMQLGVASVDGIKYPTYLDAIAASATATDPTITVLRDSIGETVGEGTLSGYGIAENNGVYTLVDNTASTWNGLAGDGLWGTAGNWSTGVVPTQYTTVTFGGDADVGIGAGDDIRMVAGLVLNGNVSLHHNTRNYSYWPSVKICGGNVTGTGTLTLERCGFVGDGSATINVACPVVFKGDSPTSHDCFLQNGPIVFNGTVSSTTGRLHVQTPVTFNGAVNLTNATINTAFTGVAAPIFNGAVTLENGASILSYAVAYNNALTIGEGAVVSIGSSSQTYGENFTMTGSGRFIGNTVLPTGKAKEALTQSTWTGTFELLNKTVTDHWWISEYGNANSKVCFNNVTTYLYNDGNTGGSGNKNHMVAGIEVGSGGFKINGSYSKAYSWSLPALSGTGTFTVGIAGGTAGTHDKNVYLPADCSEFSGNIAFADDAANTRLVFGTTERAFKEKTICVGSNAVVGAGATWTASDEIYLDGIVKASANTSLSTVVGSGKIVYGAKPTGTHTFDEGWNGIGALDYKGAERIDLADFVNTIAQKCSCGTVEVVKGCTMSLDNFFGADVTPTLKVSGFVVINDGSSNNKRTVSNVTGDGVLVFGTKGAMVNYAIDNVVGWNGVITNSASSTLVTNLVSGAGTVVYNVAASTTIGAGFGGEVEYAVAPSAAPVVNAESEATVYLNFNYAGMNIAPYGNAKSTIKLGDLSAANAYLNDGDGNGTGQIPSKVVVAGNVTINNGWTQYPDYSWTGSKTLQFNEFTVDGSFALLSTRTWNDAQCYYYIKSLNGDGAGTITVGAGYSLRIDAVDFAEAPSGDDCIVPLTVGAGTATAAAGNLYGADGVLNGPIPVTVNGVATEQSLVYDAEKGGLVLYVPPAQVTIGIPTVANTTPSVTADGEPVEIVNGQITVTDGAAIVLTYTSTTHEVANGTIEFTAADGYTVDVSDVTVTPYVASFNNVKYTTLQGAVEDWAEADMMVAYMNTVSLLDDVAVVSITVPSRQDEVPMQLSGNNHTLTGPVTIAAGATLSTANTSFVGDMTVNGTLYTITALSIDGDLVFGDGASVYTTGLDSESAVLTATGDVTVSGELAIQLLSSTLQAGSYPLVAGASMSADNAQATVYLNHVEDPNWAFSATETSLILTGAAASVDGEKFASFADAVTAAGGVKTITLLNNAAWTLTVGETLIVEAGAFTMTVTPPAGYARVETAVSEGVVAYTTQQYVAKLRNPRVGTNTYEDEVYYTSLKAALADVVEQTQAVYADYKATVTLLADDRVSFADVTVAESIPSNGSIVIDKTVVINGAGFKVYGNTNAEILNATSYVEPGTEDKDMLADLADGSNLLGFFVKRGNVTFTNITLTEFGDTAYVNKFGYTPIQTASAYAGTLTLTNVNFSKFNRTAVCVRGGTLSMTGGTVSGGTVNKNNGDYFQQPVEVRGGTATISGVTITGGNDIAGNGGGAIVAWSATTVTNVIVNFTGVGIWADYPVITVTGDSTSVTATDKALFVEDGGTINVSAGTFTGALAIDAVPGSSISITGGTFSVDPSDYVASGYAANKSGDVWVVSEYVPPSGIDPESGTEIAVDTTKTPEEQAADAQAAAAAMDVTKTAEAEAASVDQTTWNGYFTKTAEKVNDVWMAKAELNPAVVLPVDGEEGTPLTDMLESVVEAAVDTTGKTAAEVPTKAGLYYWISGATEVNAASYTPGTAVLGDGTKMELARPTLTSESGKAFFKVCVDVVAPTQE